MEEKRPPLKYPVVILAAGEGSRLSQGSSTPKPLTPLLGLTLLERALLTWRKAGARRFYVVTGWQGEAVAQHARELAGRHSLDLEVVDNPRWPEGNGTSVLAVKEKVSGPFYISMVDHVFQPEVVEDFVQKAQPKRTAVMAVDPRIGSIFDLADATKVRLEKELVLDIGKEISPYNAVDMGLFLVGPGVFQALEEALKEGDGSLTGGIRKLASQREVEAIKMEEGFWTDVDTPQSLDHAREGLLKWASHSPTEGWISRYLNRHFSRRITERLSSTSITPNQVTLLSFLAAAASAFFFALGHYGATLLAALLAQGASVLDGCDGELARLKFASTPWGAWWDTLLDRYADGALVLGITLGYSQSHSGPWTWILGLLSLLAFTMVSYAKKEYALRFGTTLPLDWGDRLTRRDLRLFALFLGGILNRPFWAMVIMAFISHSWIAWTLATKKRPFGRQKTLTN